MFMKKSNIRTSHGQSMKITEFTSRSIWLCGKETGYMWEELQEESKYDKQYFAWNS